MDSTFYVTDASTGEIKKAGGPCYGFALVPGKSSTAGRTVQLGSYPVQVRMYGKSKLLDVPNDAAWYSKEKILSFDVVGVGNEGWCVVVFDSPEEGARWGGGKTRAQCELIPKGTNIPAADPALVTDGVALRPGDRTMQIYIEGAGVDVDLWAMALDGTWRNVEPQLAVAADVRPLMIKRDVTGAIGRIAFRASAGGGTIGIDKEQEAG